jgi:hypothetical protein
MKHLTTLFVILLLAGCSAIPRLEVKETHTVKAGTHTNVLQNHLTWNDWTNIYYEYETNETWAYELGNDDQCDWNKLGGWSMHFRTNHKNSVMVGVRHDRSGKILLSPYYHADNQTYWVSAACSDLDWIDVPVWGSDVIAVDVGQSFEVHWTINDAINYTALTIVTAEGVLFWERYWPDFDKTREINPYFGGNQKAPQDWVIERTLKGRE